MRTLLLTRNIDENNILNETPDNPINNIPMPCPKYIHFKIFIQASVEGRAKYNINNIPLIVQNVTFSVIGGISCDYFLICERFPN